MDHLMVELKTVMALASMTYIVDLDGYELHPENESVFNDFIIKRVLHYAYDKDSLLFKIIFIYFY